MARIGTRLASLALLALTAAASCKSGGAGSTAIPLDQVADRLGDAFCAKLMACSNNPNLRVLGGDVPLCRDLMRILGFDIGIDREINAATDGTAAYHPDAARDCVDQVVAASCDLLESGAETISACQEVFGGTLDDAQACHIDAECISRWCDTRTGCPGNCAAPIAENGDCSQGEQCAEGLQCDGGTCLPRPALAGLGENCGGTSCQSGLYCDSTFRCAERLPADASCDDHDWCQQGLFCDPDGLCKTALIQTAEGADCHFESGPFCSAAQGLICPFSTNSQDTTQRTCAKARELGESCAEVDAASQTAVVYPCNLFADLYCDTSNLLDPRCAAKKTDGIACQRANECLSGTCDASSMQCTSPTPSACD